MASGATRDRLVNLQQHSVAQQPGCLRTDGQTGRRAHRHELAKEGTDEAHGATRRRGLAQRIHEDPWLNRRAVMSQVGNGHRFAPRFREQRLGTLTP
jgi:hypothetical protein